MAGVYGGLVGRNVSRSEEKVALRYVRGEDLGIYGSGGRGSSDTGNTGSRAWVWASGTGQSSGDRAGLGALPCGHGTGSRAMGVLAYFLAKGTVYREEGSSTSGPQGWGQQAGGPAAPTGHAAVGSGGGCRERVLARLPFCFSPERRLGPGAPAPAPPRVRRCP